MRKHLLSKKVFLCFKKAFRRKKASKKPPETFKPIFFLRRFGNLPPSMLTPSARFQGLKKLAFSFRPGTSLDLSGISTSLPSFRMSEPRPWSLQERGRGGLVRDRKGTPKNILRQRFRRTFG